MNCSLSLTDTLHVPLAVLLRLFDHSHIAPCESCQAKEEQSCVGGERSIYNMHSLVRFVKQDSVHHPTHVVTPDHWESYHVKTFADEHALGLISSRPSARGLCVPYVREYSHLSQLFPTFPMEDRVHNSGVP
jgi:hypothetical protein